MPCAIKIIKKESLRGQNGEEDNIMQELNKNELEVLELTQHPHITRVYELLEDSRNYYIVMEVVTGGSLLDRLK